MGRIYVRMPSPEGTGAGQVALFKLPVGRRYHRLDLIGTAGTSGMGVDDVEEIRVMLNGKVVQRFSGAERDVLNQFDGRAVAAIDSNNFILAIPFDRYNLSTRDAEEYTALNTGDDPQNPSAFAIRQFSVEVQLASSGFSGTPSLSMYAEQSERVPGGPGLIKHIIKTTRAPAGSGEFDITDIPRGGNVYQYLDRISFAPSANDISSAKIESDQYVLFERTKALNNRLLADGVRVPQNGYFIIDRTEFGYGGDPIPLNGPQDFRYKPYMTGAATLTVLAELIGQVGD